MATELERETIDKLGKVRRLLKKLQAKEEELKSLIDLKTPRKIEGLRYTGTVYSSSTTYFDKEIARVYLTPEQYARCNKVIPYDCVRVSRN